MAVESSFHKTHCGKPFNKAFLRPVSNQITSSAEDTRGGLIPLSTGGGGGGCLGGLAQFFLILGASMCVFNGVFMHLGPDLGPFGLNLLLEKIFLVTRETECWTKLFSDSHDFLYFFFYSMF